MLWGVLISDMIVHCMATRPPIYQTAGLPLGAVLLILINLDEIIARLLHLSWHMGVVMIFILDSYYITTGYIPADYACW